MFGGEAEKRTMLFTGSDLFLGSMLAIFVILSVLAIACLLSPNPIALQPLTYTGKVVAVDTTGNTVTVQSGPNDHRTFNRTAQVAVLKCRALEGWNMIKPGDEVSVSYFDRGAGKNVDVVALLPDKAEHCG